jgi:hypothetical protein
VPLKLTVSMLLAYRYICTVTQSNNKNDLNVMNYTVLGSQTSRREYPALTVYRSVKTTIVGSRKYRTSLHTRHNILQLYNSSSGLIENFSAAPGNARHEQEDWIALLRRLVENSAERWDISARSRSVAF